MSAGTQLSRPQLSQFDFVEQDPWPERRRQATQATVLTVVGSLVAIGALLVVRRLFGALADYLPRDTMLMMAIGALVLVTCSRLAWRKIHPWPTPANSKQGWGELCVGWGSSVALIMMAVGCCYPADRTSDWLIWLPVLIADQMWRQSFFDLGQPGLDPIEYEVVPEEEAKLAEAPTTVPWGITTAVEEPVPEEIVQQLYRVRDDQGQELIYGTLRADFHPGQRTAILHVGFCPPLAYRPEIEADALPGDDSARLKVVQALSHGARLDVRLRETPTEDCHLWIDMAATPCQAS